MHDEVAIVRRLSALTLKRVLLVHGLKRSGNHAVINWICAQGSFVVLNNVIPIAPALRGERPMARPRDFTSTLHSKVRRKHRRFAGVLLDPAVREYSVIASLEDHELDAEPFTSVPCEVHHVVIVRDPRNLFASRIRKASLVDSPAYPSENGPLMRRAVDLWKSHARELVGEGSRLRSKTGVYFDSWFSRQSYRRSVSEALGLRFTDEGFARVADRGGGSSFDGLLFDGDNERMDVLDRAARLSGDELALLSTVLEDEELQRLSRAVSAVAAPR